MSLLLNRVVVCAGLLIAVGLAEPEMGMVPALVAVLVTFALLRRFA